MGVTDMLKSFFAVCLGGVIASGAMIAAAQSPKIIYKYDNAASFDTQGDAFNVYEARKAAPEATSSSADYSTFQFAEVTEVSPDYGYASEQPQRLTPSFDYDSSEVGFKSSLGEHRLKHLACLQMLQTLALGRPSSFRRALLQASPTRSVCPHSSAAMVALISWTVT